MLQTFHALLTLVITLVLLAGCSSAPLVLPPGYLAERDAPAIEPASPELLREFEAGLNREYLLGPGDLVEVVAPVYPEIAGEHLLSPDGEMTVYPAGAVKVGGLSRAEAEKLLKETLGRYYHPVALTLKIKSYENNQVLVLGKVGLPGIIKFRSRPNLLEALARAGAFPPGTQDRRITRCDIIRGKNQMLRVSLDELLKSGTGNRNLDLANNDIIYIPENDDHNVYVLGEVKKPGVFEMRASMTLLNAIMLAGGPTETAVDSEVMLVRDQGKGGQPLKVSMERMVDEADFGGNIMLKNHDIVYVPRSALGTINYYFRMINPFTQMAIFGATMSNL